MGDQYYCENERRREAVREHATLNGIDYLEVLDQDAPAGSPPQQTLLLQCLKSIATSLGGSNITIEGGVRVTAVEAQWVVRASDFTQDQVDAGLINSAELAFFTSLADSDSVLVVRTDVAGDLSTYRLSLVQSPTNSDPPADFDPILSTVEFSFKADCPSDFDCKVETECETESEVAPQIDYLARDYASFRTLMLDRLSTTMPDWQERNPADLGVAIVEILAYAGDHLSYYQDAAATEAYLDTARRRASVRRHARLLDYAMHDGCNARAWVTFNAEAAADGVTLPQTDSASGVPTRLLTRCSGSTTIDESDLTEILERDSPEVFELMHDITLYQAHNQISFHTWGDERCCLPKGSTSATLEDSRDVFGSLVLLELVAAFISIHFRHYDVHKDEIGNRHLHDLQSLLAVAGGVYLIALLFQDGAGDLNAFHGIIHDKNSCIWAVLVHWLTMSDPSITSRHESAH